MVGLEKAALTGAQQTALVTLCGKALDSRRSDSISADREADQALRRIDYDFSTLRMRRRDQKSAAARAKGYDARVTRFLDTHPHCIVLHFAYGELVFDGWSRAGVWLRVLFRITPIRPLGRGLRFHVGHAGA